MLCVPLLTVDLRRLITDHPTAATLLLVCVPFHHDPWYNHLRQLIGSLHHTTPIWLSKQLTYEGPPLFRDRESSLDMAAGNYEYAYQRIQLGQAKPYTEDGLEDYWSIRKRSTCSDFGALLMTLLTFSYWCIHSTWAVITPSITLVSHHAHRCLPCSDFYVSFCFDLLRCTVPACRILPPLRHADRQRDCMDSNCCIFHESDDLGPTCKCPNCWLRTSGRYDEECSSMNRHTRYHYRDACSFG